MPKRLEHIEEILETFRIIKHSLAEGFISQGENHITPSQSFVLHFVAKQKKSNVKEIAKRLNITSSAATQLIDALVKNGFLEKKEDEKDRRIVNLIITEKTKKQFAHIQEKGLEKVKQIFSILSDEELESYLKITQKVVDNLDRNSL